MASTKAITKIDKETKEIPKGAKILNKEVRVTVEEIENGFIVTKSSDIRYQMGSGDKSHTEYAYITKKWFFETDPFEVKINTEDKTLADLFED